MNYEKEFGISVEMINKEINPDTDKVEKEIKAIQREKKNPEYDEYGEPVYNQTINKK